MSIRFLCRDEDAAGQVGAGLEPVVTFHTIDDPAEFETWMREPFANQSLPYTTRTLIGVELLPHPDKTYGWDFEQRRDERTK